VSNPCSRASRRADYGNRRGTRRQRKLHDLYGNDPRDHYVASVGPSIRTFTRTVLLPHISVPDGFDNPLPDAEIDAWEGKSRA